MDLVCHYPASWLVTLALALLVTCKPSICAMHVSTSKLCICSALGQEWPLCSFSSVTQSCRTLCNPMNHSTPGLPVHQQLPEFTQTHVPRVNDTIQPSHPCHPLLLLPPVPPSIRVFSSESTLRMRWPKYWSFSFSIIPSKEHQGLISFRIDWLDLLVVQGTLKSLLQHHSSKASILWCSAFFTVQLTSTGKTIALTRWTFSPVQKL